MSHSLVRAKPLGLAMLLTMLAPQVHAEVIPVALVTASVTMALDDEGVAHEATTEDASDLAEDNASQNESDDAESVSDEPGDIAEDSLSNVDASTAAKPSEAADELLSLDEVEVETLPPSDGDTTFNDKGESPF